MMYQVRARCESTVQDGRRTYISDTGELPSFYVYADTPGEGIKIAQAVVNPCGDANAVYITLVPQQDVAQGVAA